MDELRRGMAERFEEVAAMLRSGDAGRVAVELDDDGNQRIVVDDVERKCQYIAAIRLLEDAPAKPQESATIARLPRGQRQEMVEELYQQGLSQRQIADRLMVSQQTVSLDLQKMKDKDSKQE